MAEPFTVACWNVLLDQTRVDQGLILPQEKRIDSLVGTLQRLYTETAIDVTGICEAELTEGGRHNGEYLAERLIGERGVWAQHNTSRRGHEREFIGMFGTLVVPKACEILALPSDKKAVIARINKVPVAMNHFRNQRVGRDRERQIRALLERFEDEPHGVIMGDFNALPAEKVRRLMYKAGFMSVFELMDWAEQPPTFPTQAYWDAFITTPRQKRYLKGPISIDDIVVKGMDVQAGGTFEGDSDHVGLWATLSKTSSERIVPSYLQHAIFAGRATIKPFLNPAY